MSTIVLYTDARKPANRYPRRIVSPTHPSPCCLTHMAYIGQEEQERTTAPDIYGRTTRYASQYRLCLVCGYAVRRVRVLEDQAVAAELRETFLHAFSRGW